MESCLSLWITAQKTIFSFFKWSEKMVFPKKSHWNMIFLVSSGKMIFLFPKNMIFFFRRKMKDEFLKKYMEIWYFLQIFWKDGLSKKNCTGIWFYLYHQKRWHFFSRIYDNFSIAENGNLVKMVLLFPTHIKLPFCKKSKDDLLPKNTPKMILILEKMILAF